MRVAVEKMEGVEEAEVSLEEGRVSVTLAPSNAVSVERLRGVIRDQGFSPREAEVTVRGRLERVGGAWVLRVPAGSTPWALDAPSGMAEELEARSGETLVARGTVGEESPGRLRVTSVGGSRR